jgi:hypothetical protein
MWRRSYKGYKEKYEHDFDPSLALIGYGGTRSVKISQCAAHAELVKRIGVTSSLVVVVDDGEDEEDGDPVPETGFTIWDASLVLAKFLESHEGFTDDDREVKVAKEGADDAGAGSVSTVGERVNARRRCFLELGAGTGACSILLADSFRKNERTTNREFTFVVSDLEPVLALLRHNVKQSALDDCVDVRRLNWSERRRGKDISELGYEEGFDLVFGADLAYTSNKGVIRNLARTCEELPSDLFVMAFCTEHNPGAVEYFHELVSKETFEVRTITNKDNVWPEMFLEDSDEFCILIMRRRK